MLEKQNTILSVHVHKATSRTNFNACNVELFASKLKKTQNQTRVTFKIRFVGGFRVVVGVFLSY